jgi:hypothetical protein
MNLKIRICLISCVIFAILNVDGNCFAQKTELKSIKKIELITAGAWIDSYYKKVEVVFENGNWKSYQTGFVNYGPTRGGKKVNDSIRTFIKDITEPVLKQFVAIVIKPDSIIQDELFNIDTKALIAQIDSNIAGEMMYGDLKVSPSSEWKNQFIKAVSLKPVVTKALYDVLHPILGDDRSRYYILITDKFSKTDTITASATNELYYLPWNIKGKPSYNPDITKLFELIGGNDAFEQTERRQLHYQIIAELYYYYGFKASLDWDKFRPAHSKTYALISKTLKPLKFTHNYDNGFAGVFSSLRLPAYVEISCSFMDGKEQFTKQQNEFEDILVSYYKKGGFLFRYMDKHPQTEMTFRAWNVVKDSAFNEIKKRYPPIAKFDRKQIIPVTIMDNLEDKLRSGWIFLPDKKVILLNNTAKAISKARKRFGLTGIDESNEAAKDVWLIFDHDGHKIGELTDTQGIKL